jgi:hypothetical protein
MNYKLFLGISFVLIIMFGCESKALMPQGVYQSTSYNTGKKVIFDFRGNGDVYVQVSHVNVSNKLVDDSFFPFFADGKTKYRWEMVENGRLVIIHNESGFEIVRLEFTGKYLSWDKTKFTKR